MVALAEQFRSAKDRFSFRKEPGLPVQRFRQELREIAKRPPYEERLLMSAIKEENTLTVRLKSGDVAMPAAQAFGVLDLFGRQDGFYEWMPDIVTKGDSTERTAVHPSVLNPKIVFLGRHVYRPDGEETAQAWSMRRRTPEDDKLLEPPKPQKKYSAPKPYVPASTIEYEYY